MRIINQDRDAIIIADMATYDPVFYEGTLIAFNIYGVNLKTKERQLLGTVDDDVEAIELVTDINSLIEEGFEEYEMPLLIDLEELEEL